MARSLTKSSTQHAWNIHLTAYNMDFDLPGKDQFIRVGTLSRTKKPGERSARVLEAYNSPTCPTLEPLDKEKEIDLEEHTVALWVGVRPRDAYMEAFEYDGVKHKATGDEATTKVQQRSTSVKEIKEYKLLDGGALRVVVPMGGTLCNYYVLTSQDPETGLCTGVQCDIDEVFFFPIYRDDTVRQSGVRKNDWPKKIMAVTRSPQQKRKEGRKREAEEISFRGRPERAHAVEAFAN